MATDRRITPGQLSATRTLLKFCQLHGHAPGWIDSLHECVRCMDSGDASALHNSLIPFQRAYMGSFIDWFPTPLENEDSEYAEVVWNALYGHWRELTKPHWKAPA